MGAASMRSGRARAAQAAGLPVPAGPLDRRGRCSSLLCAPGFSTRDESDRASGRGVGMAVVKAAVEAARPERCRSKPTPGSGTRFTIQLPLTLAITDALIARVGARRSRFRRARCAKSSKSIRRLIGRSSSNEIMPYRGGGAADLCAWRGCSASPPSPAIACTSSWSAQDTAAVGFAVDRIVGQREIVVRPIADPLVRVEASPAPPISATAASC